MLKVFTKFVHHILIYKMRPQRLLTSFRTEGIGRSKNYLKEPVMKTTFRSPMEETPDIYLYCWCHRGLLSYKDFQHASIDRQV